VGEESIPDRNGKANGEAEVKQRSHHATLFSPSILVKLEKLAQEIKREFPAVCIRLKTLAPNVEQLRQAFHEAPRGSLTVMGCTSFQQFCREQLGYSESQVYRTLAGYTKPQREKKVPKPEEPKKLVLSEQDRRRIFDAATAGVKLLEAEETGDKEAAMKAREDIKFVSQAQPLREAIFEQQDVRAEVLSLKKELLKVQKELASLKKLTLRVAEEIMKADDYSALPADLMRAAANLRKFLDVDAASFGLDDDDEKRTNVN
jgi:hypothetical protein